MIAPDNPEEKKGKPRRRRIANGTERSRKTQRGKRSLKSRKNTNQSNQEDLFHHSTFHINSGTLYVRNSSHSIYHHLFEHQEFKFFHNNRDSHYTDCKKLYQLLMEDEFDFINNSELIDVYKRYLEYLLLKTRHNLNIDRQIFILMALEKKEDSSGYFFLANQLSIFLHKKKSRNFSTFLDINFKKNYSMTASTIYKAIINRVAIFKNISVEMEEQRNQELISHESKMSGCDSDSNENSKDEPESFSLYLESMPRSDRRDLVPLVASSSSLSIFEDKKISGQNFEFSKEYSLFEGEAFLSEWRNSLKEIFTPR
ncbi:MAG: hypothetical protein GKR77_03545 [Legionellales bacterium]|nr:hypothetical protein [Legionellales bacterium]